MSICSRRIFKRFAVTILHRKIIQIKVAGNFGELIWNFINCFAKKKVTTRFGNEEELINISVFL